MKSYWPVFYHYQNLFQMKKFIFSAALITAMAYFPVGKGYSQASIDPGEGEGTWICCQVNSNISCPDRFGFPDYENSVKRTGIKTCS